MTVSTGAARGGVARRRSAAGAVALALAVALAACGAAVRPAAGPQARSAAPRPASSSGVVVRYAALRRPAARGDAGGPAYARAELGRRVGVRPASAREVAVAAVLADRVFLVAADGAICIASSARLEIGCDATVGRAVTAHTIICSPYMPSAIAEVYGTVPDGATRLRMRLRDGRAVRPLAGPSFYRWYWAKGRTSLPRAVEWSDRGRARALAVPLPSGRGWLGCGASPAPVALRRVHER